MRRFAVDSRKHRIRLRRPLAARAGVGHTRHMHEKPHSPACERNREPILSELRAFFADRRHVLEVGSGTGEHAVHFAAALPHLVWQTSDRAENLAGIRAWLDEASLRNTPAPHMLDVADDAWPHGPFDAVFSANTLHIMAWHEVEAFFCALPRVLTRDAKLAIYGPFNVDGAFTSASNAAFDESLKARAPHMGIRDVAVVDALARTTGFVLLDDVAMPANNRLRMWQRHA
jgi:cyclopropane fatty-acyl-phospholipid synthase-like methyltransferase